MTEKESMPLTAYASRNMRRDGTTRREGREWAVQMLFELGLNRDDSRSPESFFDEFWNGGLRLNGDGNAPAKSIRTFTEKLVRGVMKNLRVIDDAIESRLINWSPDRVGEVERSVLRMGVYEIMFCREVPAAVVINEAVDICKYFGTNDSSRFVNGILNSVAHDGRSRAEDASVRTGGAEK